MKVRLGKTEITVNKDGFGALPIQRISTEDAAKLVRRAYESGMDFFDTARAYTDSEEKVGIALKDVRDKVIIATKTGAQNADGFWKDLETSLHNLQTDHVDIYQFHNPPFCPKPGGEDGLYDAILAAKLQGKVRHIGITNHRLHVAKEAIASGLYETIQFPLCYLATEKDLEIVELSRKADMGFIGMKSLSGGLITNEKAAAALRRSLTMSSRSGESGGRRNWMIFSRILTSFLSWMMRSAHLSNRRRSIWREIFAEAAAIACHAPWKSISRSVPGCHS